jgi:hypothetical protein
MPGLVWQQADINGEVVGALNAGNARPPVQQRCGTPPFMAPHGTTCAYAFVDSTAKRVDIFDLLKRVDLVAEKLPQLRPWLNKINDRKDERLFPFKMHLLTVSPAIVLVVPRSRTQEHESCGFLLRTGCIQSQSFRGNAYWFRGNPRIQDGSFWFNVDEPNSIVSLEVGTGSLTIASSGATIRLVPSGGEWLVHRDR